MKIKVCGMRNPANMQELAVLQPDYMGFIFYTGSKRYAGGLDERSTAALPSGIKKTGVFVNASFEDICTTAARYNLDAVQLHGEEPPSLCLELRAKYEVIKAFGMAEGFDYSRLEPYTAAADYLLFDTKSPGRGGSGKVFNWKLLAEYPYATPYFLSGGIGPEHIDDVLQLDDDRLYGVDLNSCFETEPGFKDIQKLEIAFKKLK